MEGFIHCSNADQVVRVANHLFRNTHGLILLHIQTERLHPRLVYESKEQGEACGLLKAVPRERTKLRQTAKKIRLGLLLGRERVGEWMGIGVTVQGLRFKVPPYTLHPASTWHLAPST